MGNTNVFIEKFLGMTGGISPSVISSINDLVQKIRALKEQNNAVILSHYYMAPELQISVKDGGIADFTGDSLGLSIEAAKIKENNIIFCGVEFMAETALILNPDKNIFIPNREAGCSLASSINADDVKSLKRIFPGVPVIAYINTYAETKAESDICCTSRNAIKIASSFSSPKVIFIPDKYMGQNLAKQIKESCGKELILWHGTCEVHEQFKKNITSIASAYPDAEHLLHWEVPNQTVKSVLANAQGLVGSTYDIINYVGESKASQFILSSECDLGATLRGLYPEKEFISPCIKCSYMKKITLENTLAALEAIGSEAESRYKLSLPKFLIDKAKIPIQRMLNLS